MKNTFFGFVLRFMIAAVIAALGFIYYGAVLPKPAAAALAVMLAAIELLGPMLSSKGAGGASLRVLVRAGASLLVWPGFAWALLALGLQDRGARIALAAAAASALGVLAAGHGQGREHARLVTTLVSIAIPVYALGAALVQDTRIAVAMGCVAVAIAFVTAKLALVWPDHLEDSMVAGAVIAIVTGFATAAPLWF